MLVAAAVNTRRCGSIFRTRHCVSAIRGIGAISANNGGSRMAMGSYQMPQTSLMNRAVSPERRVISIVTAPQAISRPNTSRADGCSVVLLAAMTMAPQSASTTATTKPTIHPGNCSNGHALARRDNWRSRIHQASGNCSPAGSLALGRTVRHEKDARVLVDEVSALSVSDYLMLSSPPTMAPQNWPAGDDRRLPCAPGWLAGSPGLSGATRGRGAWHEDRRAGRRTLPCPGPTGGCGAGG